MRFTVLKPTDDVECPWATPRPLLAVGETYLVARCPIDGDVAERVPRDAAALEPHSNGATPTSNASAEADTIKVTPYGHFPPSSTLAVPLSAPRVACVVPHGVGVGERGRGVAAAFLHKGEVDVGTLPRPFFLADAFGNYRIIGNSAEHPVTAFAPLMPWDLHEDDLEKWQRSEHDLVPGRRCFITYAPFVGRLVAVDGDCATFEREDGLEGGRVAIRTPNMNAAALTNAPQPTATAAAVVRAHNLAAFCVRTTTGNPTDHTTAVGVARVARLCDTTGPSAGQGGTLCTPKDTGDAVPAAVNAVVHVPPSVPSVPDRIRSILPSHGTRESAAFVESCWERSGLFGAVAAAVPPLVMRWVVLPYATDLGIDSDGLLAGLSIRELAFSTDPAHSHDWTPWELSRVSKIGAVKIRDQGASSLDELVAVVKDAVAVTPNLAQVGDIKIEAGVFRAVELATAVVPLFPNCKRWSLVLPTGDGAAKNGTVELQKAMVRFRAAFVFAGTAPVSLHVVNVWPEQLLVLLKTIGPVLDALDVSIDGWDSTVAPSEMHRAFEDGCGGSLKRLSISASYRTFSSCLPFFHQRYFGWDDDAVPASEERMRRSVKLPLLETVSLFACPPCGNGGNSAHIDGLHAPKLQEVQIADRRMMRLKREIAAAEERADRQRQDLLLRFPLLQKGVYYDVSFGDSGGRGPKKESRVKRPRELGIASSFRINDVD